MNTELINRIVIDPKIMVGKPTIKGTRLTVEYMIGLMSQGMTLDEILKEYSYIAIEDLYACLAFAKKAF